MSDRNQQDLPASRMTTAQQKQQWLRQQVAQIQKQLDAKDWQRAYRACVVAERACARWIEAGVGAGAGAAEVRPTLLDQMATACDGLQRGDEAFACRRRAVAAAAEAESRTEVAELDFDTDTDDDVDAEGESAVHMDANGRWVPDYEKEEQEEEDVDAEGELAMHVDANGRWVPDYDDKGRRVGE